LCYKQVCIVNSAQHLESSCNGLSCIDEIANTIDCSTYRRISQQVSQKSSYVLSSIS
jgi:hypothetical protein